MESETYIWDAKQLAAFLNVSVHWVRKRNKEIPRCPGIALFRVNTRNPEFQTWLKSKVGDFVDSDCSTE